MLSSSRFNGEVRDETLISKKIINKKSITKNSNLTESKKRILEYIKSYPNTRTKDIIYEFSALSDRTVKRNLTDLIKSGLVRKRVDNKAVYYYLSETRI